jgi:hypothetical protein
MAAAPDLKTRLVQAIRNWVHASNYAETHQRQALNFRKERATHETESIALMKQMGLAASVIQISGAKLQLSRRTAPAGLTWGYLEREVGAWAAHSGVAPATAASLLKWLHEHREVKELEYLKRTEEDAA